MRHLITLLPFLAAPLLLPPLSSGLQMAGILILLAAGFCLLLPSSSTQNLWLSKLELASVLCMTVFVILLWFLFPNHWMFHTLYPSIIAGWMILILLLVALPSPIHALGALAVASWGMLLYINSHIQSISSELAYNNWSGLFATILNPPVTPIVFYPVPHMLFHWQWLAFVSGFVFLAAVSFQFAMQRNAFFAILFIVIQIGYGILFVEIMGNAAFLVMITALISFILFYLIPSGALTIQSVWKWGGLILFLSAGASGWLDIIIMQISQLSSIYPFLTLSPASLPDTPVSLTMAHHSAESAWQFADWAALLAIVSLIAGFAPVVYERSKHPNGTAGYAALASSIVLILPFSPLQWISHPVIWICIGGFLFSHVSDMEHSEDETIAPEIPGVSKWIVLDYRSLASVGVMGLLAVLVLNTERRANANLMELFRLTQNDDRIAAAEQAHLQSYYRPDIRSIYLTWEINRMVNQSASVPDGKLVEMEIAGQMCSRYGFIPYLAIKRISDFYTLQGNSSRAVASIEDVLAMHPQDSHLHEILAERLFEFGKYQEALDHYRICANNSPTAVRLHEKMALAYKSLGKEEEYQNAMQIVHTLNPAK